MGRLFLYSFLQGKLHKMKPEDTGIINRKHRLQAEP